MLVLRCTQRLLKGGGFPVVADPPAPELPLGEWYVNAVPLPFRGRSAVIYTSSSTLLTVVTLGRALRTTIPRFQERLPLLLARLRTPAEWIRRHRVASSDLRVARTANRRVLGSMNDLAKMLWFDAEEAVSFERWDLDRAELRLAEVPLSMIGFRGSDAAAALMPREAAR